MIGAMLLKRMAPAAFDALNRHDLDALLRNYSEEVAFVYPGDVGPHGRHEGKAAVRRLLERIFRQFPRIRFAVKHVAVASAFDFFGNNIVYTHWDAEFENYEGVPVRFSGVTVATVAKGKVVLIEDFFDPTDQCHRLAWANPAPVAEQSGSSAEAILPDSSSTPACSTRSSSR
jgi:ketosteroid isomerase-like protein